MTPGELRSLADEATPGPWNIQLAAELRLRTVKGAPDPERENDMGMGVAFNVEPFDAALIALAPDLARLCAELGEALAEALEMWGGEDSLDRLDALHAVLAKLSELKPV